MSEKIYDKEIAPKLKEIGELCRKHQIPFLAVVEYSTGLLGRTEVRCPKEGIEMVMIRHCTKTAPNVDAYIIGLKKWAKENNINAEYSIFLNGLIT